MPKRSLIRAVFRDEKAATAIEYGLIIGVLSMAIITAAGTLLNGSGALWTFLDTNLSAVW